MWTLGFAKIKGSIGFNIKKKPMDRTIPYPVKIILKRKAVSAL